MAPCTCVWEGAAVGSRLGALALLVCRAWLEGRAACPIRSCEKFTAVWDAPEKVPIPLGSPWLLCCPAVALLPCIIQLQLPVFTELAVNGRSTSNLRDALIQVKHPSGVSGC